MFTANRVAALGTFVTAIAGAVAGLQGALPTSWGNVVTTVVSILGAVGVGLHFMSGSQKSEAHQAALEQAIAYDSPAGHATPPKPVTTRQLQPGVYYELQEVGHDTANG